MFRTILLSLFGFLPMLFAMSLIGQSSTNKLNEIPAPKEKLRLLRSLGQESESTNLDSASYYYHQVLDQARLIDSADYKIPEILLDIGAVQFKLGNIDYSTEVLLDAIGYFKSIENWYNVAATYLNLSINNIGIENYDKAQEFGLKGLEYAERSNDTTILGYCYSVLTVSSSELGDNNRALDYAVKSLETWENLNNAYQKGMSNRFIGKVMTQQENEGALNYLKQSVLDFESISALDLLTYSRLELAKYYGWIGESALATSEIDRAKAFINDDVPVLDGNNFNQLLEESYELVGDYREAYNYGELHDQIRDSLNQIEQMEKIASIGASYEVKEKEAELQIKESQLSQ